METNVRWWAYQIPKITSTCQYLIFWNISRTIFLQLFAHYTLNLITIFVALAFVALSIVGIVWCSGEVQYYYVKINKVEYPRNVTCPEDKTAALVIGGMAAFDSFLMAVWCTLGTFFFCCYYRAFGIESKGRGKHWS